MQKSFGAQARYKALDAIGQRVPKSFETIKNEQGQRVPVSQFYGINTFGVNEMREKLPKEVYTKLRQTMEQGRKLDLKSADTIAHAMKDWAILNGASHFCHWFQPQTGSTAEKHDAFLTFDDSGRPMEKFSGSQLIQSEPDASSFPSGGMRTTFEARGYTAWDPSSPAFLMESTNGRTLCIPSVFISYHGDALDEKTGLLRSMEVLSEKACRLLNMTGLSQVKRVVATLGAEQEYFLIDRSWMQLRPDLLMTGRTLLGGQPPKGQQLEDHYFGSIPARVLAFMGEVEQEMFKLGVPAKTRHNEVAPNQFELAPIFEEANVSTDHNQLTMEILRKVALKHNFAVLFHEKPFAGVNGSGKHNNWSMMVTSSGSDLDGMNLLEPGKTPHQNLRFLLMLVSILKGVKDHSGLLRAGIASSGNDHRLGANEAPPAIISVFLGEMLSRILDEIEKGTAIEKSAEQAVIKLGVSQLPEVSKDNTDRNRTSPFAFTGNKFEFRAVGSSASTAFPMTLLNAAVADGMDKVSGELEKLIQKGTPVEEAILTIVKRVTTETKAIRFEGNGYSENWVREAERRGLLNLKKTPEALAQIVEPSSIEMLGRLKVFSEAEVRSRHIIRVERYVKNMLIEVDTLKSIVDTLILPACYSYLGDLGTAASTLKSLGVTAPQAEAIAKVAPLVSQLQTKRAQLEAAFHKAESFAAEDDKAKALANEVTNSMLEVRSLCDQLEGWVGDDYWPLPKYREMLFLT